MKGLENADKSVRAAMLVTTAIAEAIRELGAVSNGELYARIGHMLGIDNYNAVIELLKDAGMVRESNHVLTWIGPRADGPKTFEDGRMR